MRKVICVRTLFAKSQRYQRHPDKTQELTTNTFEIRSREPILRVPNLQLQRQCCT
jgi:hypothetical protein